MLRLNDIAEQRNIYSSVDDIVYAHDSDSDFDEPYENRCKPEVQVVAAIKHDVSPPEGGFAKVLRPWSVRRIIIISVLTSQLIARRRKMSEPLPEISLSLRETNT